MAKLIFINKIHFLNITSLILFFWKRKQNYEKKEKRKKSKCDLDAAAAQETRGAPCPAAHSPNSVPWYIYYTKTHYVEDFWECCPLQGLPIDIGNYYLHRILLFTLRIFENGVLRIQFVVSWTKHRYLLVELNRGPC